jgi:BON domain-containing protein
MEAAEEGLTYVPPVDPPVRPGESWGPDVAAGFGTTAEDDPFDADHHGELLSQRDEVTDRVLEALHADAATSALMDRVVVATMDGRVVVAGLVDDLDDEDAIVAVASEVDGVTDVVSRLTVAALENEGGSLPG